MNIKSLLIGSTAALTAVTGARAADAVMAPEPEPVEYVQICDAYGAGFFYIPGTETCLQISGRVRYQINVSDTLDGFDKDVNIRVQFDARSETDWGTLRSYIRLQSTWTPGEWVDGPVSVDQAMIQLGGLFMGYTESAFVALWGGGLGSFGILHTDGGGSYAYQQRAQIGYRFSGGNGFYGAIVLETITVREIFLVVGIQTASADADVVTNVAGDLQAGLGAGDVVVADAIRVADAHIFHRFRFRDHHRIGGARTGHCDESRSGAEKQALDVHFLTSSQKLINGSGYFC
jgi:hypothetical protein